MRTNRGAVLLEVALTLPIFLLLILGGIDLNLMMSAKSSLDYVTVETARCVAETPASCPSPSAYAQTLAHGVGINGTLSATVSATSSGATVNTTYAWQPVSPFFRQVTLTATATVTSPK
jgi:Flp pilus assembly protein TadG